MAFTRGLTEEYERWIKATPEGLYFDGKQKEILISAMKLKTGERLLEIGCGTGRYVRYFTELGLDVTGIEPVPELLKIARLKEDIPEEKLLAAFAEKLPFADKSFDKVLFINTFEYVEDKVQALREAARVAREKVGIGFMNRHAGKNFFRSKAKKGMYSDAMFFTERDLRGIAEKALLNRLDRIKIETRYTLYLPEKAGSLLPLADYALEKTGAPFGNFGVMVISKQTAGRTYNWR